MSKHILTDIKQTKKGRYALFFDDRFYFSVDEEVLVKHHLEIDAVFEDEDIKMLKKESDYNRAREKAFRIVSVREHSGKELYDKLLKDYDEHTCEDIVTRFRELGIVNDDEFASDYFEQLVRKGKSFTEIRYKLLQKGIARETVDYLISAVSVPEEDLIRELIQKKYSSKLLKENGRKLVYDALVRRGFSSNAIRTVLGEFDGKE